MKKNVINVVAIITAVAAIGLIVIKLNINKKEQEARIYKPNADTKAVVQAEKAKEGQFIETVSFVGSFAPNKEVSLSPETSGKVIAVYISEGSHVNTGFVIARLDDGVLQAQLRSSKASYELASNTLKRYEEAASGVTQLQMDNARAEKMTSKAQIDQLVKQISYCVIKAPFSGVISKKSVELGAIVSTGTPLATLIDISSLKLEINVPERHISKFKENMKLKITSSVYPDTVFSGQLNFIGSQADNSHNYSVKILVPNQNKTPLRAGMYGSISVNNSASSRGISIPRSAIIGSSSEPKIYVVNNGVANLRNIKIGASNETSIQVISGLSENETLVTGGLVNLKDGSKIEIK